MRKIKGAVVYTAKYVEIQIFGLTECEGKHAIALFQAAYCDDTEDCVVAHVGVHRISGESITLFTIRQERVSQAAIYFFAITISAHLQLLPFFGRDVIPVLRAGQRVREKEFLRR